ncbi:hypothetical protein JXB41_05240 [Candidatus Woesearchaeota archaeon]|nr:hypothetical protein [Candidatus Woesearchaeota archaeon]
MYKRLTRRKFLELGVMAITGFALEGCCPPVHPALKEPTGDIATTGIRSYIPSDAEGFTNEQLESAINKSYEDYIYYLGKLNEVGFNEDTVYMQARVDLINYNELALWTELARRYARYENEKAQKEGNQQETVQGRKVKVMALDIDLDKPIGPSGPSYRNEGIYVFGHESNAETEPGFDEIIGPYYDMSQAKWTNLTVEYFDDCLYGLVNLWFNHGLLGSLAYKQERRAKAIESFSNAQRLAALYLQRALGKNADGIWNFVQKIEQSLASNGLYGLEQLIFADEEIQPSFSREEIEDVYKIWLSCQYIQTIFSPEIFDVDKQLVDSFLHTYERVAKDRSFRNKEELREYLTGFFSVAGLNEETRNQILTDPYLEYLLSEGYIFDERVLERITSDTINELVETAQPISPFEFTYQTRDFPSKNKTTVYYTWTNSEGVDIEGSLDIGFKERVAKEEGVQPARYIDIIIDSQVYRVPVVKVINSKGNYRYYFLETQPALEKYNSFIFEENSEGMGPWYIFDKDMSKPIFIDVNESPLGFRVGNRSLTLDELLANQISGARFRDTYVGAAIEGAESEFGPLIIAYVPSGHEEPIWNKEPKFKDGATMPIFNESGECINLANDASLIGMLQPGEEIPVFAYNQSATMLEDLFKNNYLMINRPNGETWYVRKEGLTLEEQTDPKRYYLSKHPILWLYTIVMNIPNLKKGVSASSKMKSELIMHGFSKESAEAIAIGFGLDSYMNPYASYKLLKKIRKGVWEYIRVNFIQGGPTAADIARWEKKAYTEAMKEVGKAIKDGLLPP